MMESARYMQLVAVLLSTAAVHVHAAPNQDKRNVILGSCSSCTQIRLAGGCSGTLEVLTENHGWGTATDRNFGVNEGTVVCRQLGCDTSTVTRSNTRDSANNVYQGFAYDCNGNEANITECRRTGARVSPNYGIALQCGNGENGNGDGNGNGESSESGASTTFRFSIYMFSLLAALVAAYFCI